MPTNKNTVPTNRNATPNTTNEEVMVNTIPSNGSFGRGRRSYSPCSSCGGSYGFLIVIGSAEKWLRR